MARAEEGKRMAIGIDLGTTYSCVAAWKHDKIEILVNGQGNRTTPSCVAFNEDDQLVGDAAKTQSHVNSTNTIFGIKRLMGRAYMDSFVQKQMKLWPFKVISGEGGRPKVVVTYKDEEKEFSAEEMSTMILTHMKEIAEKSLGTSVKDAVITVPANFSDAQRRSTRDAGEAAGLNVLRILNEPTAAAIAYDFKEASWVEGIRNVVIFDLGGGTFDVSILRMEGLVLQVKATAGDTHLGGEDMDERMLQFLINQFKLKHRSDVSGNAKALRRMRTACEKAKRALSFSEQTMVVLDYLHEGLDFQYQFTRARFEELNMDLFERCMEILNECLVAAEMDKSDVDDVVLVGGSTRIPKVQQLLEEHFGERKLLRSINPDEAVAYGAAVEAAKLVGLGNNKVQDLVFFDVTPLSLGMSSAGDQMVIFIPRNTRIPVQKEKIFSNAGDNETMFNISIYEGERRVASDNNLLAEFVFGPLPPKRARRTKFVIGMEVDGNGILSVWAEHKESGLRKDVIITNYICCRSPGDETMERNIREADMRRLEDEQRAEKYWNRARLEALIKNSRLRIGDTKTENVTNERRKKLEKEVNKADDWLKANREEAGARDFLKKWEELEEKLSGYIDLSGLTISEKKYKPAN